MDDAEMLSKAELIYSTEHLISKGHTLDSTIFGATKLNSMCEICCQSYRDCTGHYAVIQLPFPIPTAICLKDYKALLPLICPICAHFMCRHNGQTLAFEPSNRLQWIRKETEKMCANGASTILCNHCKNDVYPFIILQGEPSYRVAIKGAGSDNVNYINPTYINTILQNFEELEVAGFNDKYHPKSFMTSLIPIMPNKLRPKTLSSSESTITTYYRAITEEICPELEKIQRTCSQSSQIYITREVLDNFNKWYDKLNAYYFLITDMGTETNKDNCLNLIEKKDRKHVDDHNAIMGRFKGKEKSIFGAGIIYTRCDVSARTVLGGATESQIKEVNVPYHIAAKLTMWHPVYVQNIKFMKQIILAMADTELVQSVHVPHALMIKTSEGKHMKIEVSNAASLSAMLKPGDRVAISLLNGDLVMQSRFPSIREESWSSFQVRKDNNTIITIPLSDCEMKMADFDGDEAQIYVLSGHHTDAEALLLHSPLAQLIAYKNGAPAIWYSADAPYGMSKMLPNATSIVYNSKAQSPPVDVIKIVESFLPKDFRYKDSSTHIIDGKFVDGKTNVKNVEMHKYMTSIYGPDVTTTFMDRIIQFAYDLNRDYGNTLGYDIRIFSDDAKREVLKLIAENYDDMCRMERSSHKFKDVIQMSAGERQKAKIKKIIMDSAVGSLIHKIGFVQSRQDEYYQTVALADHVLVNGERLKSVLAEGTRVSCAYPKHSVDPCAYGYIKTGYNADVSPTEHFNECQQQRHAIYIKGTGTAEQGYMSKKLGITFGINYADFNGCLVNDCRLVSPQYGACGLSPRLFVVQPLIDISMESSEFTKKYSDKRLHVLYNRIHEYRKRYALTTAFTKSPVIKDIFIAGFNYEQYIDLHGDVKGHTPQKTIDEFIKRVSNVFAPEPIKNMFIDENFTSHEYYFRTKLASIACDDAMLDRIYDLFSWSLVDGGDPVGMKASLATSEPLTQASLHSIHKASGGGADEERIKRSTGLLRFKELLGGNSCKDAVITLHLLDDSREASMNFANEHETFYFKDIWLRTEINVGSKIPDHICNIHTKEVDIGGLNTAPYFVTSVWSVNTIAAFNIHIADICTRITTNFNDVLFITGHVLNPSEFLAYIYFKPNVTVNRIESIVEEWSMERPSTIVHGQYLKNCFVSENKNNPGHFIIEANEVTTTNTSGSMALEKLIFDPRVDPLGCRTTNPEVTYKMFGIGESSTRQYEELIFTATNLSETSGVLHRHYKVLADSAFSGGEINYASRNTLRHDRSIDIFRLIQFETARDMLQQALKYGGTQPVTDTVSAAVYGELPSSGTGCSKVTLYVDDPVTTD